MIGIHAKSPRLHMHSRRLRLLSWLIILSLIINLLPPITWINRPHVAKRVYGAAPAWRAAAQDAAPPPLCADVVPPTSTVTATPLPTIAPTVSHRTETPVVAPTTTPMRVAPIPEENPTNTTLYLPVAMRQSAVLDAATLMGMYQAASTLQNVDCRVELNEDTNVQVHLAPFTTGLGITESQFELLIAPQFGAAQVVDGTLHYAPAANFYGVDQLSWRALAADGQEIVGVIELYVAPVNDAPAVALHAAPTVGETPLAVNFTASASDVDQDLLTYIWDFGDGAVAAGAASQRHIYAQSGVFTTTVTVSDGVIATMAQVGIQVHGAPLTPEPTPTAPANRPPTINLVMAPAMGSAPLLVQMSANAVDPDGDLLSYSWDFGDGIQAGSVPTITHLYEQTGVFTATVTVSDGRGGTAAAWHTVVVDDGVPRLVAVPLDQTAPTVFKIATEFLYAGDYPIQKGLTPANIAPKQAAVLRGRVLTAESAPLRGVRITVHQHPDLGYTLSRDDGWFDFAVNGGGQLTVVYEKAGYLTVQRQVYAVWQDFTTLDDVVLTPLDPVVNVIDLTADVPMQTARCSLVSDGDGNRQSTLLIPQGMQAELVLPGGITQTLTTLHIRATEYTVGKLGPNAMPGNLPPESGYTYAVELSVDEAMAAGATQVRFSQPVYHYVENFLHFPVGMAVPSGYYDRERVAWMPDADGRVVQVVAIADGLAQLDTTGDGAADNDAALGITDAERAQLAQLYTAGVTLWRVPIRHFTPWDHNWPFGPPLNAIWPFAKGPRYDDQPDQPCEVDGSIIECESQVVGQRLALTGVPFTLNYRSDRTPAHTGYFELPVSGTELPDSLKEIQVWVEIAGVVISQTLPALPNQTFTYQWDGRDIYGRQVQGKRAANIRLRYVYDGAYMQPNSASTSTGASIVMNSAFGRTSDAVIEGSRTRQQIWLARTFRITLGAWLAVGQGLGGWSLDAHHVYDVNGKTLYQGDGSRRSVEAVDYVVTTVAGVGLEGFAGDGESALRARLNAPNDVAIATDGAIYVSDTLNCRIRRVDAAGIITTMAGTGACAYGGDGGLAVAAQLNKQQAIALAPDGALYIADLLNHRIRRIGPDGIMTTVAGTGAAGYNGDNIPAIQAKINGVSGLAVGSDGSLYIADTNNNRIRRIGPDGMITTIAGTGNVGYGGDGGPAAQAKLWAPKDVAVGPDGSLYIADWYNHRVRRVTPTGLITTVAGNGARFYAGDGGAATETAVGGPFDVEVDGAGRLFILHKGFNIVAFEDDRIRLVDQAGIIRTLAGGFPQMNPWIDGEPAAAVTLNIPKGM
ncbi:MAG: PKD domain-containing protein, partial [Caldilineaceae bacterium]|nr:PKD domain-containing protein [Caldilineaceae bacterium]